MSTESVSCREKSVFCPKARGEFVALSQLAKTALPWYHNINKRNTNDPTTHQIKLGREVTLSVIDVVFSLVKALLITKN